MKSTRSTHKKLLYFIVVFLVVVLFALYIGFPMVLAVAAVISDKGTAGEPPQGFSELTLTRHDGLHLGAW